MLIVSFTLYFCTIWASYTANKTKQPIEIPIHFGAEYTIPKDNLLTVEGIALGKKLFFDTQLSRNNTISCAICHQEKLAFSDGKTTSIGIDAQLNKRNAPSLANLLWQNKFFWDGRAKTLEEQVLHPLFAKNEMDNDSTTLAAKLQNTAYATLFKKTFKKQNITNQLISKALAQYVRSLISANSRYDKIVLGIVNPTPREKRAISLFFTHPIPEMNIRGGNCGDCHGSNLTTLGTFHDNGLDSIPTDVGLGAITNKKTDIGKMKVPSLRNVALTKPYMHDGRFSTLRQVMTHYNHQIKNSPNLDPLIAQASNEIEGTSLALTESEQDDILFFLEMLTDSSFVKLAR